MKLLGIDYGTKKIGLALGSSISRLAQPYSVIPSGGEGITQITRICQAEEIDKIVIGRSLNYQREDNLANQKAISFSQKLKTATGLPIAWEDETLTTKAAERLIGKDIQTDARAAALILDSFLIKNYDQLS